jgi:hypothetical protein
MGVPQFPQTLPPNTVVGRLGTSAGPAQAVPMGDIVGAIVSSAGIEFIADGAGVTLTTGVKAYVEMPFAATITRSTLVASPAGNLVIDIWKCRYAAFDGGTTHPVAADSITAGTPPTITAGTKAQDALLSGWTITLREGDILAFNIVSVSGITKATLSLEVSRIENSAGSPVINFDQVASGSHSGVYGVNKIKISSDDAIITAGTPVGLDNQSITGLQVEYHATGFNGANRVAVISEMLVENPIANGNRQFISNYAHGYSNTGVGGTAPTVVGALGEMTGHYSRTYLDTLATNWWQLSGGYFESGIAGTAANHFGIGIVSIGAIQGNLRDVGVWISSSAGTPGFKTGISFSNAAGGAAAVSGTLIGIDQFGALVLAYGLDLNNTGASGSTAVSYSGGPIRLPYNSAIVSRNDTDTADVAVIGLIESAPFKEVRVGSLSFNIRLRAASSINLEGILTPITPNVYTAGQPSFEFKTVHTYTVQHVGVPFASLPAAPVAGMTAYVTDSTTAVWGAVIAGLGGNKVLAFYNGTNWTVAGK